MRKFLEEYGRLGDKSRLSSQLNILEAQLKREKAFDKIFKLKEFKKFL